ncbi:hypothetical protein ACFOJF_22940 [Pseudocitrobacter faecalis]
MQSVKSTMAIAAFIFSAGAFAEPTSALPFPAMPDTTAGAQPVHSLAGADTRVVSQPTQGQDNTVSDEKTTQVFLKEVVESDYEYQLQARQLKQQVELEKMRSEIRKLRGEDKKPVAAVSQAAPAQPAPRNQKRLQRLKVRFQKNCLWYCWNPKSPEVRAWPLPIPHAAS